MTAQGARVADPLSPAQLRHLLAQCERNRYPDRDRVVVLLSHLAGLKIQEIAGLRRWHVLQGRHRDDAEMADVIHLETPIRAPGRRGGPRPRAQARARVVPVHPSLRQAIDRLMAAVPGRPEDPLILSERSMLEPEGLQSCMRPASISTMLARLYAKAGMEWLRPASGRAAFVTGLGRALRQNPEATLADALTVTGYKTLDSLARHMELADQAVADLIRQRLV